VAIELTSPAFSDGETIPARYSRDGLNEPPPLEWTGVPAGTAELAVVVLDPDAPRGTFVHWIVAGLDPALPGIGEGPTPAVEGRNGWGEVGYGGPKPPPGDRPHRYIFTLYALAEPTGFVSGAPHVELLDAMRGKELTEATLVGYFGS
jgi:Raf kinase inhibitor-like YbhB/YbcL family protein